MHWARNLDANNEPRYYKTFMDGTKQLQICLYDTVLDLIQCNKFLYVLEIKRDEENIKNGEKNEKKCMIYCLSSIIHAYWHPV